MAVIGLLLVALVALARDRDIYVDIKGVKIGTAPGTAARTMPGEFGLSDVRIDAELRLYHAILRLQTARKLDGVEIPKALDDQIGQFWRTPEGIGPGETDVDKLTAAVMAYIPPPRRRKES